MTLPFLVRGPLCLYCLSDSVSKICTRILKCLMITTVWTAHPAHEAFRALILISFAHPGASYCYLHSYRGQTDTSGVKPHSTHFAQSRLLHGIRMQIYPKFMPSRYTDGFLQALRELGPRVIYPRTKRTLTAFWIQWELAE